MLSIRIDSEDKPATTAGPTSIHRLGQNLRLLLRRIDASALLYSGMHLLYPWRCPSCNQPQCLDARRVLCQECLQAIKADLISTYCTGCGAKPATEMLGQERCGRCRTQPMAFSAVAVAGCYEQTLRRTIVHWKFHRRLGLERLLASLLAEALARQPWHLDFDAFVPIPQPWPRWLSRGFRWPVRDLALEVSATMALLATASQDHAARPRPVWSVLRARRHRPQVGLSRAQRMENARRVFYVPACVDLSGKAVCLIDDVMTTGATLNSAAKALRRAGAQQIWALALARTHAPASA